MCINKLFYLSKIYNEGNFCTMLDNKKGSIKMTFLWCWWSWKDMWLRMLKELILLALWRNGACQIYEAVKGIYDAMSTRNCGVKKEFSILSDSGSSKKL